jgi:rhodanese-related sulfurtransferase
LARIRHGADNPAMGISTITPKEALQRQQAGAVLVDVREAHERATGFATGAVGIARAELEADPKTVLPDTNAEVLLICQSGGRSLKAAEALHAAGYGHLASVEGGTTRWIAEGLPLTRPEVDSDFYDRYSRHLLLPEVGEAGQRRLEAARVALSALNPRLKVEAFAERITAANVERLIVAADVVIDGADNFPVRYLLNDACV